ncbi:MAG: cytochrome d ubiquinol oxidase subunit II [Bacteroidales bacterium]|jgi:cytochrome d ubiquinol oxidase subunit II|nr:cytochrome d ubiquinol oxidase subunit II [Bacteroidales bacterium]
MDYTFFQNYWWFLVSLLGGLLVFLLFVQGGNALIMFLGKSDTERTMMVNSTGRKWEFTFTTLVTFGGAFFASFPLFYSTSFGGAYWLWMLILFTFVLQAVSYEFRNKAGNLLGKNTYHIFLTINGLLGPLLLGAAVATFFTGSGFHIAKENVVNLANPIISSWDSAWHGLEELIGCCGQPASNWWNYVLGLAVMFLAQILGLLYYINNIDNEEFIKKCRKALKIETVLFLIFFLTFLVRTLLATGYAVDTQTLDTQTHEPTIYTLPYKYLHNFLEMPTVTVIFLVGVLAVLAGILLTIFKKGFKKGIWFSGIGTVLTVLGLLLCVGYNNTAYYPSTSDMQSSLTLANSCSSLFTLKVMSAVSLLIPFVLLYIFFAWRALDKKKITSQEMEGDGAKY